MDSQTYSKGCAKVSFALTASVFFPGGYQVSTIPSLLRVLQEALIIALFDNDSAAQDELQNLKDISLPDNIRIMKLPEIEIARNYPTLSPLHNQNIDINGMACSIELFFCKDILRQDDGTLTPIRWTGYKDRIKQ